MNTPALQVEVLAPADRETLLKTVATSLDSANGSGELVAIIAVKVNRLKAIAIEYGYAASDELLEMFLERVHDCLRSKDTLVPPATTSSRSSYQALKILPNRCWRSIKFSVNYCNPLKYL
jgi:hypothetical protein